LPVLLIQAVVGLAGGPDLLEGFFRSIGLSREGVMAGKLWQIVTYGFVHGGWLHVLLNTFLLLVIGSRVEHMIGRKAMLKSSFACIVAGGLFHLLTSSGLLVGMSGACVGLLLLLVTLSPQSRMFPLPVSGKSLGIGILAAEFILLLMDPGLGLPFGSAAGRWFIARGWGEWFQIGHACHFGGGVMGWVCGRWILRPTVTLDRLRRDRARREAGLDQQAR
jgi:membrane associated rhomboid family serine protease